MKLLFETERFINKKIEECRLESRKIERFNYPEHLEKAKLAEIDKKLKQVRLKIITLHCRTLLVNITISNEIRLIRKYKNIYEQHFKESERKFKVLSWILYLSAILIIQKLYLRNLFFDFHLIHKVSIQTYINKFDSIYGTIILTIFFLYYSWYFLKVAHLFFSIKISILLMKLFLYIKYRTSFFVNIKLFSKSLMFFTIINLFIFIIYLAVVISFLSYVHK